MSSSSTDETYMAFLDIAVPITGTIMDIINITAVISILHIPKKERQPVHWILLNLLCSDLLCITNTFVMVYVLDMTPIKSVKILSGEMMSFRFNNDSVFVPLNNTKTCWQLLFANGWMLALISSSLTVLALVANLLIILKYPFKYNSIMTWKKMCILFAAIWIISSILALADFIIGAVEYYSQETSKWNVCIYSVFVYTDIYYMFPATLACILVISLLLYAFIIHELRKITLRAEQLRSKSAREARKNCKKRKHLCVTVFVLLLTLILFWGPFIIVPKLTSSPDWKRAAWHLISAYPIINPIIYVFRLKQVRKGHKIVFTKTLAFLTRIFCCRSRNVRSGTVPIERKSSRSSHSMVVCVNYIRTELYM